MATALDATDLSSILPFTLKTPAPPVTDIIVLNLCHFLLGARVVHTAADLLARLLPIAARLPDADEEPMTRAIIRRALRERAYHATTLDESMTAPALAWITMGRWAETIGMPTDDALITAATPAITAALENALHRASSHGPFSHRIYRVAAARFLTARCIRALPDFESALNTLGRSLHEWVMESASDVDLETEETETALYIATYITPHVYPTSSNLIVDDAEAEALIDHIAREPDLLWYSPLGLEMWIRIMQRAPSPTSSAPPRTWSEAMLDPQWVRRWELYCYWLCILYPPSNNHIHLSDDHTKSVWTEPKRITAYHHQFRWYMAWMLLAHGRNVRYDHSEQKEEYRVLTDTIGFGMVLRGLKEGGAVSSEIWLMLARRMLVDRRLLHSKHYASPNDADEDDYTALEEIRALIDDDFVLHTQATQPGTPCNDFLDAYTRAAHIFSAPSSSESDDDDAMDL